MLSVLIPNYNTPCYRLVADLHAQLESAAVPFEIIVAEDGSTQFLEENGRMAQLPRVKYLTRKENVGRFKIRQFLPTRAQYPWLLCMDGDAEVVRPDFIEKYLHFIRNSDSVQTGGSVENVKSVENRPSGARGDTCVLCGGLVGPAPLSHAAASDPTHSLRLKYTEKRESRAGVHKGFTTFNYLIPAAVARAVQMPDEKLFEHYGHEDTLYGILLKRAGVQICHIDNPLRHLGLETNEQMLQKAVWAGENLMRFYRSGQFPELAEESKLLNMYLRLNRLRLTGLFKTLYRPFARAIERNLLGVKPSLFLFDIWRLAQIINSAC